MLTLILTLSMIPTKPATPMTQIKPCVWPNVCRAQPVPQPIAQVETCVWPKTCGKTA